MDVSLDSMDGDVDARWGIAKRACELLTLEELYSLLGPARIEVNAQFILRCRYLDFELRVVVGGDKI